MIHLSDEKISSNLPITEYKVGLPLLINRVHIQLFD